jgi:hypothetical protein
MARPMRAIALAAMAIGGSACQVDPLPQDAWDMVGVIAPVVIVAIAVSVVISMLVHGVIGLIRSHRLKSKDPRSALPVARIHKGSPPT